MACKSLTDPLFVVVILSGFHIGKEEHELRKSVKKIDFKELLEHFQNIQHKHAVSKKTRSAHREKLFRNGVL